MSEIDRDLKREALIRGKLRELGSPAPVCLVCGEDKPWRLERDHSAGRKHDGHLEVLCRNHHADRTFRQMLEPTGGNNPKNVLEVIGKWMLGIAGYLGLIIDKFWEWGEYLIELAKQGYGEGLSFPSHN
jgi:hypothetical protein